MTLLTYGGAAEISASKPLEIEKGTLRTDPYGDRTKLQFAITKNLSQNKNQNKYKQCMIIK